MTPLARDMVAIAERLGFTYEGHDGQGHLVFAHPNGRTARLPATPSEYRGLRNSQLMLERIAGRKLPRVAKNRPRKKGQRSGFSIDAARRESADWHDANDATVADLTSARDQLIADCHDLARRRHTLPQIPPLLARIAVIEDRLSHLGSPVDPFDPFALGKETTHD